MSNRLLCLSEQGGHWRTHRGQQECEILIIMKFLFIIDCLKTWTTWQLLKSEAKSLLIPLVADCSIGHKPHSPHVSGWDSSHIKGKAQVTWLPDLCRTAPQHYHDCASARWWPPYPRYLSFICVQQEESGDNSSIFIFGLWFLQTLASLQRKSFNMWCYLKATVVGCNLQLLPLDATKSH